ncbi:MAG TPA: hypothetical protein VFU23_00110 [Gemmatimonadales bacterium]|nr:hypothetical protein [Gemmatimonadales bacterium]
MTRTLLIVLQVLFFTSSTAPVRQTTPFAGLVARLSEPGGFFDSDNLVSNETSYLHVLPAMRSLGVKGGAYLGVGPEQNFSYLAEIQPDIALLIDIRRDNMLLHLLFKAMFETAENRVEYLCLLYGRPVPPNAAQWNNRPLEEILLYLEFTPGDSVLHAATHASLMERVTRYGVPLTDLDRATLRRFHDEFASAGLNLRYSSLGRPSRPGYPSQRDLYTATDLDGVQDSYLSSEERFRVVRDMERQNRIVPVVGDLSGPLAMKSIAAYLKETHRVVSAFYVSNVEMYLFRQGSFPRYAENVRALPSAGTSVIVRSSFGRGWRGSDPGSVPQPLPGHLSVQLMQTFASFLDLTARPDSLGYWDLLINSAVDLHPTARPH